MKQLTFDDIITKQVETVEPEQVEDVTREQLLEALELLVQAVDAQSGLPDHIEGSVHNGLRAQGIARTEYICGTYMGRHKGYARRHEANELDLAQMIFGVLISLAWFSRLFKLRVHPDSSVVRHAAEIANRYYGNHPAWVDDVRIQGREEARYYLFNLPQKCETKEQFEILRQERLEGMLMRGDITQEQKETWIEGWDLAWKT